MIPYSNRVWLQGKVASRPSTSQLNARTKVTSFQLVMVEAWTNEENQRRQHRNVVTVEVVGRDADYVAQAARLDSWATVEGYLRSDEVKGAHGVRVRTLAITIS